MHTGTVPGGRDRNAAARESFLACRCTFAALDDVATRPGQSPFREYVYAPSRELRGEAEATISPRWHRRLRPRRPAARCRRSPRPRR
jgi:hypothetical protein